MTETIETVLALMRTGEVKKANAAFAALMAELEREGDADTWAQNGYTLLDNGFTSYALALYRQAEDKFPADERWPLLEAEVWMADGDFDQALDQLLLITEDSPYYLEALLLQADAYQGLFFPEMSELKLKEAQQLAPDEPAIILGLAELNYHEGNFKAALPYYRALFDDTRRLDATAVKIATDHFRYALGASGQFEEALQQLEAIPEAERTQEQSEQMVLYYVETEDFEKANSLLEPLYDEGELSGNLLTLYADVLTYYHDEAGAIRVLDEAIAKDPVQLPLYEKRAQLYIALHQDEAATRDLKMILAQDEEAITARLLLLRTLLRMDRAEEALEVLEETPVAIQEAEFDWLSARTYDLNEDYEKALEHYQAAYPELTGDDSFMYDYLTFVHEEGRYDLIEKAFTARNDLKDMPTFQWLYEEMLDHQSWED
ncbi:MAG: hypothetical protein Q4A67_04910 [Aerococcus sp.]|nr:hypothetical protein [Aerococcus sp.]